jgi:hypothetical protein
MKRWLCWLLLAVGVVFLLWIPHCPLRPHLPPQDRSVLSHKEFVSIGCRALRAMRPACAQSRASPSEFFATREFGGLIAGITDEDGPPWLDYRGPPGPNACHRCLVTSCKASGLPGSLRGEYFPAKFSTSGGKFKTRNTGFFNTL